MTIKTCSMVINDVDYFNLITECNARIKEVRTKHFLTGLKIFTVKDRFYAVISFNM